MNPLPRVLRRLRRDRSGGTAIEYGLIAGLIAAVVLAGVITLATDLGGRLGTIATDVASAG